MTTTTTPALTYPYPCPLCGGAVVQRTAANRVRRYHAAAALPVPDDLPIATCDQCQTEWLDAHGATQLDAALAEVYRRELADRATRLIARLHATQQVAATEVALGLTRGYLSRVRAGRKAPSAALVAELALIAADPPARLAELRLFWAAV